MIIVLYLIVVIALLKKNKLKPIVKSKKKYYYLLYKKYLYSKKLQLVFKTYLYKYLKQYDIELINCTDKILQRVKYLCPQIYTTKIDYDLLKQNGIDIDKAIYVEEHLTKNRLTALLIAKQVAEFNVIVFIQNNCSRLFYEKLKQYGFIIFNKKEIDIKLMTNIYKTNINYEINNLYQMGNIAEGIYFYHKNKEIIFNNIINNNEIVLNYNNEYYSITVKCFNYKGFNFYYEIINKYNKTINIEMKIIKQLIKNNLNYYNFIIKNNSIKYINLFNNKTCYINYNNKFKILTSMFYNISPSNKPLLYLHKKYTLCPSLKKDGYVVCGENDKQNYIDKLNAYNLIMDEYFMFKVYSKDKKIDDYFNIILKNEIVKNQFNVENSQIELLSYQQAHMLFKIKKISAFEFYNFLKNKYFGINLFNGCINVSPICDYDFTICFCYLSKKYLINIVHGQTKCMIIDNVRYLNINSVKLEQIAQTSFISLVI